MRGCHRQGILAAAEMAIRRAQSLRKNFPTCVKVDLATFDSTN